MSRQYGALSGIAILLILLNHVITLSTDQYILLGNSQVEGWLRTLLTLLLALGTFAVPIFLFISGSFITYAARGKANLSFQFVWGGLKHIIWPYVIWSFVYYLLVYFRFDETYSLSAYLKNLIVGYPFHFVPLIVFWYVLSPLLVRVGRKHGVLLLTAIGLYQLTLILISEQEALGLSLPNWTDFLVVPVLSTTMALWGIYLPMGIVFGLSKNSLSPHLKRYRWIFIIFTAAIFIAGIVNALNIANIPLARYFAPVPLMFLLPIIQRGKIPAVKRLEHIGRHAYGIYLTHLIVIGITLIIIERLIPQAPNYWLVLMILLYVVGLFIPLGLMKFFSQGQTRRYYRYVFG